MKNLKAGRPTKNNPAASLSDIAETEELARYGFTIPKSEYMKLKMYALKREKKLVDIFREFIRSLTD
ncbi:MAG: hypothetical protein J6P00_06280 [Acetobacter sp.]|nr:hypothetical protein [Acetobacter sp.]